MKYSDFVKWVGETHMEILERKLEHRRKGEDDKERVLDQLYSDLEATNRILDLYDEYLPPWN